MTYLAVPISGRTYAETNRQIEKALAAGAEAIELRTDYIEKLDVGVVQKLVSGVREMDKQAVPIIVTCRDSREGGANDYPLQLRIDVLVAAVEAGADFVDLEYRNFTSPDSHAEIKKALSRSLKSRLILSAHDFDGKFEDIVGLFHRISALHRGAIVKLVYTAKHINDCFEAFDLLHETCGERIVFCMGEAGLISRILAKKLGSSVVFGSMDERSATAPGQLTIEKLRGLYRHNSMNCDTELYGVIADPVGHSLSPVIHNACFESAGMNKLYLPLLVQGGRDALNEFLDNILARPWLDFRGFSVTIPHKENALDYVRTKKGFIEPLAEKIGAVNTLVFDERRATPRQSSAKSSDERLIRAYNTDYAGALDAITYGMGISRADLRGMQVAVVGAGGVARAIVAGLINAGAKLRIYNRTIARAENLAGEFGCESAGLDDLRNLDATMLINCTSIGMHPHTDQAPVPAKYLKKGMIVFDTVYNPVETLLLRQAKEAGAKTIDGMSMFINQAAAQFRLFTSQEPDADLMRKTAIKSLKAC